MFARPSRVLSPVKSPLARNTISVESRFEISEGGFMPLSRRTIWIGAALAIVAAVIVVIAVFAGGGGGTPGY
jgi:hypothetical protein